MWKRFFSRQARRPSGLFGRFVSRVIFDKGNQPLNTLMLEVMAPQPGQAVLEIGFGCGSVIKSVADAVGGGRVEGIDFSDAMMDVARKRNRHHIEAGRVVLTHGDFDAASYAQSAFDTVCSANTIYFWPDPAATCSRIHSVLKPGGRVVLAFVDKSKMDSMPLDMDIFRPMAAGTVAGLLEAAGFSAVETRSVPDNAAMLCVAGRK
ncbi:class I SAM-dependent methyltransferase [Pseudodesulfovibrio portus]|uniref:Methyltransferase domain-containing protein n=1 Tax=Pseudodesulfovibrio portus TaxID=231439 RepID=A0ABM8AT86_9BACT|nr:class I SAM-dependent methyltransferase [Pseudodesulfovibrio portus]BDQ34665.1 hypothetical protein JCM14722_22070 [Pseudodesulfovibrio portus]